MQTESIELSILSIFSVLSFFIVLIIEKNSHKFFGGSLLDSDFLKPQAFHKIPISRSGGLASIISLIILISLNETFFSLKIYDYLFICLGMFILGFLDDLKININPSVRLLIMIIFLVISINFYSLTINRVDIQFLSSWLQNKVFLTFFILTCFLFIINGSNLIDGFNGLLVIHLFIINSFLILINLNNNHLEFSLFLGGQSIILLTFLLFNFPKAKIFLGDGGAYLFGSMIALNIIYTNNLNPQVSSFYFCILLFYLFFEVFFSFFRKLILKKSPLKPDNMHLHMLIFRFFNDVKRLKDSNYLTAIFINFFYLIMVSVLYFYKDYALVCRISFFALLAIYVIIYLKFFEIYKKNQN